MKDLQKIPPDSEFWTNPPLPKVDNNNGGWLSWCQQLSEDTYDKRRQSVVLAEDGVVSQRGHGIRAASGPTGNSADSPDRQLLEEQTLAAGVRQNGN